MLMMPLSEEAATNDDGVRVSFMVVAGGRIVLTVELLDRNKIGISAGYPTTSYVAEGSGGIGVSPPLHRRPCRLGQGKND